MFTLRRGLSPMTSPWLEATASTANPLDLAEQVLLDRDWVYDRPETQELIADFAGSWCNYRFWLNWHEAFGALTFSCIMDTKIPEKQFAKVYPLLAKVNEKLWLGHFDLSAEDRCIVFRYAMPLKGGVTLSLEQIEDLLDIAVAECERFYPAFQSIIWGEKSADSALALALMDTVGEA